MNDNHLGPCSTRGMTVCSLGEVRMPSGKTARPNITDNKDGTVTVKYAPTEKGLHEMDIKYDGNHIPGDKCLLYLHRNINLGVFVIILLYFFKTVYQK